MLTCNAFSKTIRYPITAPVQKLLFLVRFSASSSDSSDSDSDTEKRKEQKLSEDIKKPQNAETDASMHLNKLLSELNKENKKSPKPVNIVMKPRQKDKKASEPQHPVSYEKKLYNAAKDVATSLGGDTKKTESDLISKIMASDVEKSDTADEQKPKEEPVKPTINLNALITSMRVETVENAESNAFYKRKVSTARAFTTPRKSQSSFAKETEGKGVLEESPKSVLRDLMRHNQINQKSHYRQKNVHIVVSPDYFWTGQPLNIFNKMESTTTPSPVLSTWQTLEEKNLKLLTTHPPQNIFQELIQWTEQGKLWKFPIDNEQGLQAEQSVHFSEHVFLERHLQGWCPKQGPIRHFMELVCVGLSKNPYITVSEKLEHITWYKEYFESKRDVLERIGAIESTNVESKQIESS